jgi:hypothetical protein
VQDGGVAFLQVLDGGTELRRLDVELVVGLGVHEHQRAALAVEVLHLALVDDRERHLLVGAERALEHGAAATFLSLVRTNAPPLPGFTCWNSTTVTSPPTAG